MAATSPLRSGQEMSRMAEGFIVAPPLLLQVFQYLARGIRARTAGQSRAWMRSAPTQIQMLDRRAISRPVEQRTHGEELVKRKFSVEDLPAGHSILLLEIARRDDLVRQNEFRQIWRVLCECLNDCLTERFALLLPVALQFVRRVLNVDRHHVLAFRSKRGIGQRWNRRLQIRLSREVSVLRLVKRPLQIIDLVADVNASLERSVVAALQGAELRQRRKCQVNFRYAAIPTIVLQLLYEVRRKMCGIGELEQRAFRIGIGNDRFRRDL